MDHQIAVGDTVTLEYRDVNGPVLRQMVVTKLTPSSVCGHPKNAPALVWRVPRYRVVAVQGSALTG